MAVCVSVCVSAFSLPAPHCLRHLCRFPSIIPCPKQTFSSIQLIIIFPILFLSLLSYQDASLCSFQRGSWQSPVRPYRSRRECCQTRWELELLTPFLVLIFLIIIIIIIIITIIVVFIFFLLLLCTFIYRQIFKIYGSYIRKKNDAVARLRIKLKESNPTLQTVQSYN